MKTIVKGFYLLFLIILCHQSVATARPYYGLPFVNSFSSEDYHAGIQNYMITQDNRGILYVGNHLGLLEYDGTDWNLYPVPNRTKVRSVVVDAHGRIFVGAQNEFGYFFPGTNGKLSYTSLSGQLSNEEVNFGEVSNIFNTPGGIYFLTFSGIYKYYQDELTVIAESTPIGESFYINRKVRFQQWEAGLSEIDKDEIRLVSDNNLFNHVVISDIIPYTEDISMICTVENGIYLYDDVEFKPWGSPYQETLKSAKISTALRLRNGTFAFGTETGGVFILDNNGQFLDHITKGSGLNNRSVLTLFQDNSDNLWAGLYNGITHIKYSSPFTSIDERVGLPGTGYASLLFDNQLLLGTNNGLFAYEGLNGPYIDDKNYLIPIPGTQDKVYCLQNIDGQLFMAHHYGAYTLISNSKRINRLSDANVIGWWKFLELNDHPNALIGGTYNGLFLLKKLNGLWTIVSKIAGLNESSRVMEEDANGDIWMSHGYKGVFRFRLNASMDSITSLRFYDSNDGFPSNILINVFKVNNRLIFTTEKGIYSFNEATSRFDLDKEFTALLGDQILIKEMSEDSNGNIYFIGDLFSGRLTRSNTGTYELDHKLFSNVKRSFNDELENITVIDVENILIGGKEGFIHYNPTKQIARDNELNLLLRSVEITSSEDSVLFTGSFVLDSSVTISQPKSLRPVLDYENNSMLFSFTTTDFDSEEPAEYRYMMEGLENEWSEWSTQNELGFTNLYEGSYTLKIQARNQWEVLSNELSYSFKIKPPFYRTILAYSIYFLAFVLSLTSLILSLRRKYKRDQRRAVEEEQNKFVQKETEFNAQAKKSEEEIIALRNEKLRSEINYKNRELANSTMHLISKNEFISKIKTQLNNLANTSSIATGKELKKISKEIDKNISFDDDWKQFEIHFDQVHGDFSRRLKAAYPHLTNQDMKLCAYLKLNMTTKEIANMLNITVRGVELSRYRLRKKLGLDRSVNLTDFILGF